MWYLIAAVFALLLVVMLTWQVINIVRGYRKAQGTPWQRLLAAFSDSLTIMWARIVAFVGIIVGFVINLLPSLDPTTTLGTALQGILNPKWTPFYIFAIALITEWVRRRPGSIDPITPPAQSKP